MDEGGGGVGLEGPVLEHGGRFHFGDDVGVLLHEGVEEGLVVGEDGLDLLAGEEAAVDLDGGFVGDEVDLHAAVDDADVAGGGAEERVLLFLHALVVFLEGEDDAGHGGDGVDAEVGLGAVGGFASGFDAPAEDAFAGDDAFELGGLGDDGGVGLQIFAEFDDAAEGVFLVHDGGEPDLAEGRFAAGVDVGDGVHHGGEAGLVIDGAAAVELAIADDRIEGVDGHAFDGDGVHVGLEDEAAGGVEAGDAGDDVVAAGKDLLLPDLDAALLEEAADVGGHLFFAGAAIIGTVDAVDADEVGQGLEHGRHAPSLAKASTTARRPVLGRIFPIHSPHEGTELHCPHHRAARRHRAGRAVCLC